MRLNTQITLLALLNLLICSLFTYCALITQDQISLETHMPDHIPHEPIPQQTHTPELLQITPSTQQP